MWRAGQLELETPIVEVQVNTGCRETTKHIRYPREKHENTRGHTKRWFDRSSGIMKSSALGSMERACQQVLIANLLQVSVCQQPSEKFCQASQCTAASITEKEIKTPSTKLSSTNYDWSLHFWTHLLFCYTWWFKKSWDLYTPAIYRWQIKGHNTKFQSD